MDKLRFRFSAVTALIALLILFSCQATPTDPEPQVFSLLANTTAAPDGFYPGEWAVISVDVYGAMLTGPDVNSKVDLVFLVDESGSMSSSDPTGIRHTTIDQILSGLNPSQHRAGIVVFSDHAQILGGYSALTTNFSQLANYLNTLPAPNGFTNIAHAMELSNSLLEDSTANHRIAILLTDGFPESASSFGYDTAQDAEINTTHVPFAITEDINYYVVHLSASDWVPEWTTLLQDRIAGDTGGQYFVADDADELSTHLPNIVNEASSFLVLKDVSLDVQFRMGPNEYSEIDDGNIILFGANAFQVFPQNVTTDPRAELPDNQGVSIKIPVTSHVPIPPGSPPDVTEIDLPSLKPSAKVSYHLGDDIIKTKTIPQVTVTWRRNPEVLALKRFDPGQRRLTVSVTNFIDEGPITDVELWEALSLIFEAEYLSATPMPQRIVPILSNNNDLAYLYWKLGDIAPFETKAVSFDVRYHGPASGMVPVNMGKPESIVQFTRPDGTVQQLSSGSTNPDTRWYGDNKIDATILNVAPEVSLGPDLIIRAGHNGGSPGSDMTITPEPVSISLWNDAYADNGYDEYSFDAAHANPEPLDLNGKNTLWIRIDNRGNQPTMEEIKAEIYILHKYCACPSDLDMSIWHHLGTKNFGTSPLMPGQFRVQGFEWNTAAAIIGSLRTEIIAAGKAFIKVVVTDEITELRFNNNAAVKAVPILP